MNIADRYPMTMIRIKQEQVNILSYFFPLTFSFSAGSLTGEHHFSKTVCIFLWRIMIFKEKEKK